MAPPNVVLVVYDQLAAAWLEAGLRGAADLPNFARLAGSGTYFSRCFSTNPVCSPARASIATGLRSVAHGVLQLGYRLSPELPTFMRALAAAGWHTAACGKLHLRPHWESLDPDYRPYGFKEQHVTEDPRGGPWLDWVRAEHPEHFRAVLTTVWARAMDEFADYGPQREDLAALMADLPELGNVYELPFPEKVSQTNWITARALEVIAAAPPAQSLLCQVGYVQPHNPYAPPRGYRRFVNFDHVPPPVPATWEDDPLTPPNFGARASIAQAYEWRRAREHYFADLVHLDRQLGRILDGLAESGRERDTYVIATADHGDLLLDHGLVYKDSYHYDACVRVPMLVSGPGLARGAVRDELVTIEDIYPTIHGSGRAFVPAPARARRGPRPTAGPLCGRAFAAGNWPAAASPPAGAMRRSSSRTTTSTRAGPATGSALCAPPMRAIRFTARGPAKQLFDLAADPDEQENLAADPARRRLRQQMRDRLLEYLLVRTLSALAARPLPARGALGTGTGPKRSKARIPPTDDRLSLKRRWRPIIAILAVLVLVAAAGFAVYWFQGSPEPSGPTLAPTLAVPTASAAPAEKPAPAAAPTAAATPAPAAEPAPAPEPAPTLAPTVGRGSSPLPLRRRRGYGQFCDQRDPQQRPVHCRRHDRRGRRRHPHRLGRSGKFAAWNDRDQRPHPGD